MTQHTERELDIVVFGATGFAGGLIAEYLAEHAGDARIGLAARSHPKLLEVRNGIPSASDWPLIIADTQDEPSLQAMAARTRVLITTVGPYLRHGLPVVAACVASATHYLDLAGEVVFMRRSIDAFNADARRNDTRIIHASGFDSLPSDLGVLALHQAAKQHGDGALGDTRAGLIDIRGGTSGGTVATAIDTYEAASGDPAVAKIMADPYALSPDRRAEPNPGDGRDLTTVAFDTDLRAWVSPFPMAGVNTRVVRRSNALLGYAYSKDFRYQELMANGAGPQGLALSVMMATGIGIGFTAVSHGPSRAVLRRVLPKPGSGPSEQTRRNGRFAFRLVSTTPDGRRVRGLVAAQGDPGYGATAMMISQSALTLLRSAEELPGGGGVLTPATALGTVGMDRLIAAGMTINAYVED